MEKRTLFELTSEARAIEDALIENGGELTPELEIAMTDNREALVAKVESYGMLYRKFKYTASMIAEEIKRLQAMKKTAENGEKRIKERLEFNMRANEMTVLEGGTTRVSFAKNPASIEADEEAMIAPYLFLIDQLVESLPPYIKIDVKVSKDVIKQMYKETGVMPAGAELVQTESIRIK